MVNRKDLKNLGKLQKAIVDFMNNDMCAYCKEQLIEAKRKALE